MKRGASDRNTDNTRTSARTLVRELIRPHRARLAMALGLNVVVGCSVTFQNLLPKFILDDALLKEGLERPERIRRLLLLAGGYVFVGIVLRAGVWHVSLRLFGKIRESCLAELRYRFFHHVNRLCITFHNRHNSGELFSYLFGSPLANVQQYFSQVAMGLPYQVVSLTLTLAFLGFWDLLLTGIILVSVGLHFAIQTRARLLIRDIHQDFQVTEARISGRVADLLRGHRALKLHGVEDATDRDFVREMGVIHSKSYRRDVASHLQNIKQESVFYSGYALLCAAAGWRFLDGHISEGQLTAYLTSFIALQGPLGLFFQIALLRGGAQASLERIAGLMAIPSTTPEPAAGAAAMPEAGEIRFEQLSFGYGDVPVLRDFSLVIPQGQKVALVGPSGAGKSTLAQLLLRLHDPVSGRILLAGRNLRDISSRDLRKHFGVVPQDPYLFQCSIRDNLSLVDPSADDARIREACEQANAWEFISKLPLGLDTPVGEGGNNLSGGQRQRLAIARALLGNPSAFLFDEATSALDPLSEQLIQQAFARMTSGKTAILIAHRLASIRSCDRVLVLEQGRIVQDGTFDALAGVDGPFRDMLRAQYSWPDGPSCA